MRKNTFVESLGAIDDFIIDTSYTNVSKASKYYRSKIPEGSV